MRLERALDQVSTESKAVCADERQVLRQEKRVKQEKQRVNQRSAQVKGALSLLEVQKLNIAKYEEAEAIFERLTRELAEERASKKSCEQFLSDSRTRHSDTLIQSLKCEMRLYESKCDELEGALVKTKKKMQILRTYIEGSWPGCSALKRDLKSEGAAMPASSL